MRGRARCRLRAPFEWHSCKHCQERGQPETAYRKHWSANRKPGSRFVRLLPLVWAHATGIPNAPWAPGPQAVNGQSNKWKDLRLKSPQVGHGPDPWLLFTRHKRVQKIHMRMQTLHYILVNEQWSETSRGNSPPQKPLCSSHPQVIGMVHHLSR